MVKKKNEYKLKKWDFFMMGLVIGVVVGAMFVYIYVYQTYGFWIK